MCAGVGCQHKDIKEWRTSKHTKDPDTDKGLPMRCASTHLRFTPPFPASDPPHLSQPERVGDECAMCGKCDPNRWRRSKKLERADGSPAPICQTPCYNKECAQIKKEAKQA
jgi:hypothetical protein